MVYDFLFPPFLQRQLSSFYDHCFAATLPIYRHDWTTCLLVLHSSPLLFHQSFIILSFTHLDRSPPLGHIVWRKTQSWQKVSQVLTSSCPLDPKDIHTQSRLLTALFGFIGRYFFCLYLLPLNVIQYLLLGLFNVRAWAFMWVLFTGHTHQKRNGRRI